jgi:acyl-CoA thioester hydrolase
MSRPPRPTRAHYGWFHPLETRWMDNDMYGHVNNVIYYSYFDTAIAHFLIREGGFAPLASPVIDFAVETGCRFHSPLAFPDRIAAGLRVGRVGRTSVRWEIGLFRNEDEDAAADGHFIHVFVDREDQRPVPVPATIRAAIDRLMPG